MQSSRKADLKEIAYLFANSPFPAKSVKVARPLSSKQEEEEIEMSDTWLQAASDQETWRQDAAGHVCVDNIK